jgi:NAD dependent epimerase/dehydratase
LNSFNSNVEFFGLMMKELVHIFYAESLIPFRNSRHDMQYWNNKKVLITGSDGFIGSHLVEELLERGAQVRAYVFYNSFNSWGWIDTFPDEKKKRLEIFAGDVRDPYGVRAAMKDIDVVFHLAALIAIPFSYHSPDTYIDTNVKGTLNIVQAAKDLGVKRVLVTSTSEVFGTATYVPMDEKHPRQPQSPYSASKIGADCIAESFYRSFGTPITIVRPFNTYGPRQSARAVIPTIITQLMDGMNEIRLGDITPTRDLLFVKDTARAFVAIAECDALIGQDCNIATGEEISVGDLANKLIAKIRPQSRIVSDNMRLRPEKSEVFRLLGSCEKLVSHTGWAKTRTLDAGLDETIAWFAQPANRAGYKSNIYNL